MKTSTICDNCGMSYVWFDRDALNKSWITLGIPVVIYGILFYEFVVKDEILLNTNMLPILCIYHFQILCTVEKLGISGCRGPPLAIWQCSS